MTQMLKEAIQNSYRRRAEQVSLQAEVSRRTVKNKIYALKFPPDNQVPKKKKTVKYLYIDADEAPIALQFREKKGDLTKAANGIKNNGQIVKMVCIYEGKERESFHSKRKVLTNHHYFCGVKRGEANQRFFDEIQEYLERNYELEKMYRNADGGMEKSEKSKGGIGIPFIKLDSGETTSKTQRWSRRKQYRKSCESQSVIENEYKANGMEQIR